MSPKTAGSADPVLTIDGAHLRSDLEQLATFGGHTSSGITRLAYSAQWQAGRRWLREQMESIGMLVRLDQAGNLIGSYPGTVPSLPPLATGSHTDTVCQGGRFDGALGVLAGLACVRALIRAGVRLRHSLQVIDFACEEATYGGGTLGSMAMAGLWDPNLLTEPGENGDTLGDLLRSAGIDPDAVGQAALHLGALAAFVELHIEQGGVLEAEHLRVGVVESIVGIRRYRATFTGRANHAGTTPMSLRDDALVHASAFVQAVLREVLRHGNETVGTVGQLLVHPGSPNVIPGQVDLTVDIRGRAESDLEALEQRLIARAHPVVLHCVLHKPPVAASGAVTYAIQSACDRVSVPYRTMVSGAGHDAMYIAQIAPMAMIFVPSRSGVSHSPDEWTSWADCALGAQVLLETLRTLDGRLDPPRAPKEDPHG